MKNFYTQRPYWQNDMGGSDHCYILDAVTAVHVLTATNKQLYLWICMTKIAVLFWKNKQIQPCLPCLLVLANVIICLAQRNHVTLLFSHPKARANMAGISSWVFCCWYISNASLTWPASTQISWTKESVYIRKGFDSHRTGLEHQHGRCFIVLGDQYGPRDMPKRSISKSRNCSSVGCLKWVQFHK